MGDKKIDEIQETVGKLRFLSKVKKGERLCIDGLSIVENTFFAKFARAWNIYMKEVERTETGSPKILPEGREKTFQFIKELYEEGFNLANTIINETDKYNSDLWSILIKGMKDGQPGIKNLMDYYDKDRRYIANVEIFIDLLNTKIASLENDRTQILGAVEETVDFLGE